jgi:predicted O-linked N-acetylglucosamine transferase (SPINDLY family)
MVKTLTPKQQEFLARCIAQAHAANAGGHHRAAIDWCEKALRLVPGLPEAWYNLGLAHAGEGRAAKATEALLHSAALLPDHPDAQNSIGLQLMRVGAQVEAERCLLRCLTLAPDFAFAHSNLGLLRNRQNRLAEAAAAFGKAIALQPRLAAAHANLGATLNMQAHFVAGEAACRRAIAIDPKLAEAWSNLAIALLGLHRVDEAETACREALSLDPALPEPHTSLARVLMARGDYRGASEEFRIALAKDPHDGERRSSWLYCLNYFPGLPPSRMLAEAREFGREASRQAVPFDSWQCAPDPGRRLRVGLVSGDFRRHPVGYLLRGPLNELDPSAAEIFAYSNHVLRDDLTEELASRCASWIDVVGTSDAALARRIHEDRIDILVDLSGHSEHGRLAVFAWRPAPVQVTWLGYFATTGVAEIAWKIGDPRITPESEESHFSEKIWRLPDSCFCFSPPRDAPDVAALPCAALGFVTYGCFNNLDKLNDEVIDAWSRLLHADATSRLFLKSRQLDNEQRRRAIAARFARRGVAQERLLLEGRSPYADYLAAYGRVDIALDPFPYAGGMTTAECLWMGVPVVTLVGDRFISHQGESLLHAAGLPEWIAADTQDYLAIARRAASDPEALARTRAGLRERVRRSALFDAPRYARHLEDAWRGMWRLWCESGQ